MRRWSNRNFYRAWELGQFVASLAEGTGSALMLMMWAMEPGRPRMCLSDPPGRFDEERASVLQGPGSVRPKKNTKPAPCSGVSGFIFELSRRQQFCPERPKLSST